MVVNDTVDFSDFLVAIQDGVGLNHLETVVRDGFPSGHMAAPPATSLGWRVSALRSIRIQGSAYPDCLFKP